MKNPSLLTKNSLLASLGLSLGLALIAFLVWRFEITFIVGWAGLAWSQQFLYSPLFIAVFVALATVLPFYIIEKRPINEKIILPVFLLFLTGILSYYAASILLMSWFFELTVAYLSAIVLVNSFIFYFVLSFFVKKISKRYILAVIVAIIGAALFSNLLNPETVKAGVPFFWIVWNMGLVATLAARYSPKEHI